jgi:hypothetical protein
MPDGDTRFSSLDGSLSSRSGWLVQGPINASGQIGVQCGLPSFDGSGNLTVQNFCNDFILLTK